MIIVVVQLKLYMLCDINNEWLSWTTSDVTVRRRSRYDESRNGI